MERMMDVGASVTPPTVTPPLAQVREDAQGERQGRTKDNEPSGRRGGFGRRMRRQAVAYIGSGTLLLDPRSVWRELYLLR